MPIEAKTDALGVIGIFQLERSDATERAYRHYSARDFFEAAKSPDFFVNKKWHCIHTSTDVIFIHKHFVFMSICDKKRV